MWIDGQTLAQKIYPSFSIYLLIVLCSMLQRLYVFFSDGFCIPRAVAVLFFSFSPDHGEQCRGGERTVSVLEKSGLMDHAT